MNPLEFFDSIYLGDRACTGVVIDTQNRELKLRVDSISRVRGATWDYYTAEDIDDGFVVFEKLKSFSFTPPGPLPDDYIEVVSATAVPGFTGEYRFEMSIGAIGVRVGAQSQQVILEIVAESICLEDSKANRIRT